MLKIKVTSINKGIVTTDDGFEYEVTTSFHARRINGEYKYHELYVYLNQLDEFKALYKAPKTLRQKWFYNEQTNKFKGPKLLGYEEFIGANTRCKFNINELEFE